MSDTNGIRIISAMTRNGGAGKSTFCRAVASAAIARGENVTIFDTDVSQSCYKWMQMAERTGCWSPRAQVIPTMDIGEINEGIEAIYERPDQEHLILIDTFGGGTEAQDEIALLSHMVVVPMMLSRADWVETLETVNYLNRLGERVADASMLPKLLVLKSRVANRTAASQIERAFEDEVVGSLPAYPSLKLANRNAYIRMDNDGLLGQIVANGLDSGGVKTHLQRALDECDHVLTFCDAIMNDRDLPFNDEDKRYFAAREEA